MLSMTKKSGYGLIALCYLAGLEKGERASARTIAETYGIPVSLLMNVLKQLCTEGFVRSIRGAHGGYAITKEPRDMPLIDVMEALEGPVTLAACITNGSSKPSNDACTLLPDCPIAEPIYRVHQKIRGVLCELTLEDIITEPKEDAS
jgi:Rrf2 family protein